MKTTRITGWTLLALGIGAAAQAASAPSPGPDVQRLMQRIDTSSLTLPGSPSLPREAMAFRASGALSSFLPGQAFAREALSRTEGDPTGVTAASTNFSYWSDPASGLFLLVQKEASRAPRAVAGALGKADPQPALQADARASVRRLGIADAEIGRVLPRRVVAVEQAMDSSEQTRRIVGYKVFFERAINGIEVVGSRITVSYTPEGRLRKVLGTWPSLAAGGHVLQTSLERTQIAQRVAENLAQTKEVNGSAPIHVRLIYAPESNGAGDVHLVLKAEAAVASEGAMGGIRVHLVDLGS